MGRKSKGKNTEVKLEGYETANFRVINDSLLNPCTAEQYALKKSSIIDRVKKIKGTKKIIIIIIGLFLLPFIISIIVNVAHRASTDYGYSEAENAKHKPFIDNQILLNNTKNTQIQSILGDTYESSDITEIEYAKGVGKKFSLPTKSTWV